MVAMVAEIDSVVGMASQNESVLRSESAAYVTVEGPNKGFAGRGYGSEILMARVHKVMSANLGISKTSIDATLEIKNSYRTGVPICVPGDPTRILLPEYLINPDLDLVQFEDPLPLAMMATRDPESPMALAAVTRLSPKACHKDLIAGVYELVGEKTRHPLVSRCIDVVRENDFSPKSISFVRTRTRQFIVQTRKQYAAALKAILRALLDGDMVASDFVQQFIQLTEAGSLQSDVRQKLVTSLLLSETVRPGIKFLMLEHFESFPLPTRQGIILAVAKAPESKHIDVLKEELRWIVSHEKQMRGAGKRAAQRKSQTKVKAELH